MFDDTPLHDMDWPDGRLSKFPEARWNCLLVTGPDFLTGPLGQRLLDLFCCQCLTYLPKSSAFSSPPFAINIEVHLTSRRRIDPFEYTHHIHCMSCLLRNPIEDVAHQASNLRAFDEWTN